MSVHIQPTLLAIALLSLTACTAWYKPGADEEELNATRQRCEDVAPAANGQEFLQCMQAAGWRNTRIAAPVSAAPDALPAAGVAAPEGQVISGRAATATGDSPVVRAPSTGSANGMQNSPKQAQTIRGWVHSGDDNRQLDDARTACAAVADDGEKYSQCMQSEGWRPLGIRITVEAPGDLD